MYFTKELKIQEDQGNQRVQVYFNAKKLPFGSIALPNSSVTDRNPLHSATREFGHSRQLSQSHFVEGMRRIRFKDIVKMAENETLKVNVESGEEYERPMFRD